MDTDSQIELLMELGPDPTLRAAIKYFEIVGMPVRGYTQRTRQEYGKDLRDLASFLERRGVVKVRQVALPQLEIYQAAMIERRYTPSTRQRKTCAIRSLFTFLHQHAVTPRDVAQKLLPPPRPTKLPRHLSKREYQALTSACAHHPRDHAIIQLMLQTGMAVFEIARAQMDDLLELPASPSSHIDNMGLIRVYGRHGREREIPLNQPACAALRAYIEVRPDSKCQNLFLSRRGEPLRQRAIRAAVAKHLAAAGISGASARSLRHTHGAHHALRGTSRETVQKNLGLAQVESVEKYWELAQQRRKKALQEHAL